jgi:hypothetical protein
MSKNKIYLKRMDNMIKNSLKKLLKTKLQNNQDDFLIELVQLKVNGVKIKLNKKLDRTLACAGFYKKDDKLKNPILYTTIELNPMILDMSTKFKRELLTHELAHCWDFYIRGYSHHDKQWKNLHKQFNGSGETFIFVELYKRKMI